MVEGLDAGLAADAAILEPSPRRCGVEPVMVVHPNHPKQQLVCHAVSARHVAGPNRRGQTKPRVVGDAYCFGFMLEGHNDGHRSENLLLSNLGATVNIVEHGRLDEKPERQTVGWCLAPGQHLGPGRYSAVDHGQDASLGSSGDHRSELRPWVGWVP